jgi:hypothetical protein
VVVPSLDARALGLDAVFPAFFLAILAAELRDRRRVGVAGAGALLALVLVPVAPPGVPVLAASAAALVGSAPMSAVWLVVVLTALTTVVTKGIGPAVTGSRELPAPAVRVVVLLAPALLAALVVTNALADGDRLAVGAGHRRRRRGRPAAVAPRARARRSSWRRPPSPPGCARPAWADGQDGGMTPPPTSPADEQQPTSPVLHEALEHLGFLVGTWHGLGVVGYPTIEEARYEQEVVFSHDGRPFLHYASRSWIVDDAGERVRPAASEVGWWRPGAEPRSVEVVLAHHTGVVEVYVGEVAFTRVELATDVVARTATAKEVNANRRLYGLVGGEDGAERDLAYAVDMAAVGQPLQPHLSARLVKQPANEAV